MTAPAPRDPDAFARSLDTLARAAEAAGEDVRTFNAERRQEALAQRKRDRVTHAVGVVVCLLLLVVLAVAWQNQRIGRQNAEISNQIADCTTAGGVCYEQGRERTGAAINELVRANMAVHECVDEFRVRGVAVTHDALNRCVARKLAPPTK